MLRARARPLATAPDGRQVYALPNGMRLVLSPTRQAKKELMKREDLSPRQYRKKKKALARSVSE